MDEARMDENRMSLSNPPLLGEAQALAPDASIDAPVEIGNAQALKPSTRIGQFVVLGRRPDAGSLAVYVARDAMLDRAVLLYACPHGLAEPFRARLRTLAQFRHARLFALHDMIETDSGPVAVCAYEDGRPLATFLQEAPRNADLLGAIAQSFEALEVLHRHGLALGAIDAERMLVTPTGGLKLSALAPTNGNDADDAVALLGLWHASLQAANIEVPQRLSILLARARHEPLAFAEIHACFDAPASAPLGALAAIQARAAELTHLRGIRFDIVLVVAIIGLGAALAWTPAPIPDESSTAVVPQEIIQPPPLPRQFEVHEQQKQRSNTDKYAAVREAWAGR